VREVSRNCWPAPEVDGKDEYILRRSRAAASGFLPSAALALTCVSVASGIRPVVAPIKLQITGVFGEYCFTGEPVNPVA
jgi:hypothetical protein